MIVNEDSRIFNFDDNFYIKDGSEVELFNIITTSNNDFISKFSNVAIIIEYEDIFGSNPKQMKEEYKTRRKIEGEFNEISLSKAIKSGNLPSGSI